MLVVVVEVVVFVVEIREDLGRSVCGLQSLEHANQARLPKRMPPTFRSLLY
jgi:hypothetical protein